MSRLPTYFVSHGGGPWPYMKDQVGHIYDKLEASLQDIPRGLGATPDAVLVISGHWEAAAFTLSSSAQPPMIYDYTGFPAHTYTVQYSAPGSPALAQRVQGLIEAGGQPARLDPARGFDHGTFTTMFPMFPQAQVPVVQLSLLQGYDPAAHLALGRMLAPLRDEGILIVGSGLSYHNLREFGPRGAEASAQFDAWLQETLLHSSPAQRVDKLIHWAEAPAARRAHPREDHLLPLMVAVGAAENESAVCNYHEDDFLGGMTASGFRFGALPGA